jgi:hypothetical protein
MGIAFGGVCRQNTAERFEQTREMFGRIDEQLHAVHVAMS